MLNVDISRDLDLLAALRSRLAVLGIRAEIREHLMSLLVFAAPPDMPVCVFVDPCGRFFSWQNGQEWHPVTDLSGAAVRLAASADRDVSRAACRRATESAQPTGVLAGPTETREKGRKLMTKQASAPMRVMTSESSWKCSRTYPGSPDQVRHARAFLGRILEGCVIADDAVLLISELCSNAVQHSSSREPGGTFTVHAEVYEQEYIWAEVRDCGGLWVVKDDRADGRGHGLDIMRQIASDWGRDGDPVNGWIVWFRLEWSAAQPGL